MWAWQVLIDIGRASLLASNSQQSAVVVVVVAVVARSKLGLGLRVIPRTIRLLVVWFNLCQASRLTTLPPPTFSQLHEIITINTQ